MHACMHGSGPLPAETANALARYRYRIFVEQLGWDLPVAGEGLERDQFDRSDTVHVIARDGQGAICGCARLLPTTRPYLLKELFPFLLADPLRPPAEHGTWELSRFAAQLPDEAGAEHAPWAVQPMMALVVRQALRLGARRLIAVTFLSMERLFRRIGIHAHRAGPPQRIDQRMVVACWIDLDAITLAALGIDETSPPIASWPG